MGHLLSLEFPDVDQMEGSELSFSQENSKLKSEIESVESRLQCILEELREEMRVDIQVCILVVVHFEFIFYA